MTEHPTRCARCGGLTAAADCPRCGPGARPPQAGGYLLGVLDLPRGLVFVLRNPGLWHWMIIPFLVNLGIWIGLFLACRYGWETQVEPWIEARLGEGFWSTTAEWSFFIAYCLLAIVLFRALLSVVGAPFYDFLSEGVEKRYLGGEPSSDTGGLAGFLREMVHVVWVAILTTAYILLWTVVWLPVLLIPLVGTVIYFLAMARLCTFELLDFTFARKNYRLREKVKFHRSIFLRSIALGAMLNLFLAIPVLGWVAYPIGVVSATLLYCDAEK